MEKGLMELVEVCERADMRYEKVDENLERAAELESLGLLTVARKIVGEIERRDKLARLTEWGYLLITPEKIRAFLEKKVSLLDAARVEREKVESGVSRGLGVAITMEGTQAWLDILREPTSELQRAMREQQAQQEMMRQFNTGLSGLQLGEVDRLNLMRLRGQTIARERAERMLVDADWSGAVSDGRIGTEKITSRVTVAGRFMWVEMRVADYPHLPPQHVLDTFKVHKARNVFDYFTIASVENIPDPLLLGRIDGYENRAFIAQWGDDIALEDVL